jgi:hypothetical protein
MGIMNSPRKGIYVAKRTMGWDRHQAIFDLESDDKALDFEVPNQTRI